MKGSFILRGCSCVNDITSLFIFSADKNLSLFIKAKELSLDSIIVERRVVFINFSWLKLLSLSQDVIGSVKANLAEHASWDKREHYTPSKHQPECQEQWHLQSYSSIAAPMNHTLFEALQHGGGHS